MTRHFLRLTAIGLAGLLLLSSCGRKADLLPPSAAVVAPGAKPQPKPVEDKPFLLDPLL